jgi:hypothetical protein
VRGWHWRIEGRGGKRREDEERGGKRREEEEGRGKKRKLSYRQKFLIFFRSLSYSVNFILLKRRLARLFELDKGDGGTC